MATESVRSDRQLHMVSVRRASIIEGLHLRMLLKLPLEIL